MRNGWIFGAIALVLACGPSRERDDVDEGEVADAGSTDGGESTRCAPGAVASCSCANGATGSTTCLADGSGFGACECATSCTPGSTTDCACERGGSATKTCNASGTEWGACSCPVQPAIVVACFADETGNYPNGGCSLLKANATIPPLDLGAVHAGTVVRRSVRLANNGDTAVTFRIRLTEGALKGFSLAGALEGTVLGSGAAFFEVKLEPSVTGPVSGRATIELGGAEAPFAFETRANVTPE